MIAVFMKTFWPLSRQNAFSAHEMSLKNYLVSIIIMNHHFVTQLLCNFKSLERENFSLNDKLKRETFIHNFVKLNKSLGKDSEKKKIFFRSFIASSVISHKKESLTVGNK